MPGLLKSINVRAAGVRLLIVSDDADRHLPFVGSNDRYTNAVIRDCVDTDVDSCGSRR